MLRQLLAVHRNRTFIVRSPDSAAGAWVGGAVVIVVRQHRAAALEDAEVLAEIANKAEVRREAAVMQHAVGVAAHREGLAGLDMVVLVEDEGMGRIGDTAVI